MGNSRADIIQQLQREILSLGGLPSAPKGSTFPSGPAFWKQHFPEGTLPTGAVHEFLGTTQEDMAATTGFIAALMASCLPQHGATVWISPEPLIFPPALCVYKMEPHQVIFIHPSNEKDLLWTTEEALKCGGLRAVIAETKDLGAMPSRRLQLAVEKSRVTGFLLNRTRGNPIANNCVSRWKVTAAPSTTDDELPGLGHPRWDVELRKIRNGKPGQWTLEWSGEAFAQVLSHLQIQHEEPEHKRTG
jgi:protein ImuA